MAVLEMKDDLKLASRKNQRAVRQLRVEMNRSATLDPNTGKVQLNQGKVRAALRPNMRSRAEADRLAASMAVTAKTGMAIVGSKTDPTKGAAVPWSSLEQMALFELGLPDYLRAELGTANARSARSAREAVESRLGEMPEGIFAGPRSRLLVQESKYRFAQPPEIPAELMPSDPTIPTPGDGGGPSIPTNPNNALRDAQDVARCLINGTWSGWWDGWTGWIPGWKACLNKECADKLANLLLQAGGGDLIGNAVRELLKGQAVSAVLKAVLTPATLVLPLIAALLALNIKAVNWAKGACILCSWPWTGGIVFWAAAG